MKRLQICTTLSLCYFLLAGRMLSAQTEAPIQRENRSQAPGMSRNQALTLESTAKLRKYIEILRAFRDSQENVRSDQFKKELLQNQTPEQVELLEALYTGSGSRTIPESIRANLDIVYQERTGTDPKLLSLDIYAPKKAAGKLPVMVMIHGGGWRLGDKSNKAVGIDKAKFFTAQGFVYVSINYRLTPEVQHPGHIVDVAAAIAWIHNHIEDYGGAPEMMFVMGHSAGAHLAALVATDESRLKKHDKDLSIIDGVVLLDGAGYDIPKKLILGNAVANAMYRNAFTDDEETQTNASPIHHVEAGKNIPPFLIIPIARRADSNQMSNDLRDALKAAQVDASIHVAEGKTHGSVNSDIGKAGDQPTGAIVEFLNRVMLE